MTNVLNCDAQNFEGFGGFLEFEYEFGVPPVGASVCCLGLVNQRNFRFQGEVSFPRAASV